MQTESSSERTMCDHRYFSVISNSIFFEQNTRRPSTSETAGAGGLSNTSFCVPETQMICGARLGMVLCRWMSSYPLRAARNQKIEMSNIA